MVSAAWAHAPLPLLQALRTPARCSADDGRRRRRRRPAKKAGAFSNTIDDLTMKRMGRGTIYYGERAGEGETEAEIFEDEFLKDDAVLVAGGTGRTGQWIVLGLLNQGFNVRCLTRSFGRAEALFGPSGSNVDVFEGNVGSIVEVQDAVNDAAAVVCSHGAPWWLPGGFESVDARGVENLVRAAVASPSVKRFVLVSADDGRGARGTAKRRAEDAVRASEIPYVILRPTKLVDVEGGLKSIRMTPIVDTGVDDEGETGADSTISRVDLAQVICQSLVYDRRVADLQRDDPTGDFDFPSCTVRITNGKDKFVPDRGFWRREFVRISRAGRADDFPVIIDEDDAAVEGLETLPAE